MESQSHLGRSQHPAEGSEASSHRSARDDQELLRAWANGERDAGTELIERHYDVLARFFRNKAEQAAEDLIQTTFLSCLEAPDRFAGRSSFRTYLLSVARFTLYRHYRDGGVRRYRLKYNTSSAYHRGPSPASVAAQRSDDRNLLRALRMIPLDQQVLLELAYWEDLSSAELAEVLDLPLNTVYSRIHRAKRRLREALSVLEPDEL